MRRLRIEVCLILVATAGQTASAAAQTSSALTLLETETTMASIGVVASYTGDDDNDARAWVEWRQGAGYQRGHDLVRLPGRRWAGSLLFLAAATDYDVQVVVEDPDNPGPIGIVAPVSTRDDAPPPASGGDWWVDAGAGSDLDPGTAAQPFRTIQRGADAAQAGDTVHVRPGVYREHVVPPRGGTAAAPIRFSAEGAGVVLDGSDPALESGAPWTLDSGFLWWTPLNGAGTSYVAVDDARIYDYQTLGDLKAENGNLGTPGVIPGGFYVDLTLGRLWLITSDHTSPAGHAIHVAVRPSAFLLDTLSDIIIDGFEMRYYGSDVASSGIGVDVRDTARSWVRNNYIHHLNTGVRVRRPLASQNVIEGNTIRDTSVYGWPWSTVKAHTPEASAIAILEGHGNVVRCNDTEGNFNGIYTGAFGDADEDIASDTDVYDNHLREHGDDGLELEGAQRNVRAWGNRLRDVFNMISLAPIEAGPVFLVRNVLDGYKEHALKINNATYGYVFLYHNTAIPLPGASFPDAQALAPSIPFGAITTRNNIWEANRYVIEYGDTSLLSPVDWDHDDLYTHDIEGAGRFVKWLNLRYPDLPSLVASGTIEGNGHAVAPAYEDPAAGDYRLVAGHALIDQGVVLPGINDGAIAGLGPDLGAVERGAAAGASSCLVAPATVLLRNGEWPGVARAAIFTGSPVSCPLPLDPGCPPFLGPTPSLDPWGPDCLRGVTPSDDDAWVVGFACGSDDPDGNIVRDETRPLLFYQVDRSPSACNTLRLVKTGPGSLAVHCL